MSGPTTCHCWFRTPSGCSNGPGRVSAMSHSERRSPRASSRSARTARAPAPRDRCGEVPTQWLGAARAGEALAGLPQRSDGGALHADPLGHHGGEFVADHRRGRRPVDHQRRAGGPARAATRARIHAMVVEGDDPLYMLTAIVPATCTLLARSGLRLRDIRPVRGQRGVRFGGAGVGPRDRGRPRPGQRQRRRHRPGPSPGRVGGAVDATLLNALAQRAGLRAVCVVLRGRVAQV